MDSKVETGWTLDPVDPATRSRIDIDLLDALEKGQRSDLFDSLAAPEDVDASDASALRAPCDAGLRIRIHARSDSRESDSLRSDSLRSDRAGDEPIVWLRLRHSPRDSVDAPVLAIELHPGAHCVLVETHDAESRSSIVQHARIEIRLAHGATLTHLRIMTPRADDRLLHRVHARLERGARYHQALIASGCGEHEQHTLLELQGEQASARSAAVLFAAGSKLEHHLKVRHSAARTRSAVDSLAVVSQAARVVVDVHGRIDPGSADAEVHQRLSALPSNEAASGKSRVVLRPHLEILHDQVEARHGATWGKLPEDALFYASQRGLAPHAARAMIIEGMANATLARSFDPHERDLCGIGALLAAGTDRHLRATSDILAGSDHG